MTEETIPDCFDRNPYVGPRPFHEGEAFYGREREARGLTDMLIASRIVLLHAPSGAGKTSLIQAAVAPALSNGRFQICVRAGESFSALRVNEPPPEFPVDNRYVYSTVLGLAGHLVGTPQDLATTTVAEALTMMHDDVHRYQLVVFDQLEEVLTLDPTDRDGQREFFRQVGEALDDQRRWALLSMREDYMGGLDWYLKYIPGRLRATYRLGFLDEQPALNAIRNPAKDRGVEMTKEAARGLFDDLRTILVQGPDKSPMPHKSPYVEPVLLQVVCHRMWHKKCKHSPDGFDVLDVADIGRLGKVNDALRHYYADVVEEASGHDLRVERVLRDWVAHQLITEEDYRSQTRKGPAVPDEHTALGVLQDRYLVRSDERGGATWWELCHDRLIAPIREDNASWRSKKLEPWQVAAHQWHAAQDDDHLLLRGDAYRQARRWLARNPGLATEMETQFIERSSHRQAERAAVRDFAQRTHLLTALLMFSAVVNVILIIVLVVK